MTGIEVALVVGAVQLALEGAKYLVKKTKSTKDDAVVNFIAEHEVALLKYLSGKLADKPAPDVRPRVVDHRTK